MSAKRGPWGPLSSFAGESASGKRRYRDLATMAPFPGGGISSPEELSAFFRAHDHDGRGFLGKLVNRFAKRVEIQRGGDAWGRFCGPADSYVAHVHASPFNAAEKAALSRTPLRRGAGEECKSRMREVSSRKAVRPVVGLHDGGGAPSSPVPDAAGLLDDIGTGDTGASALQRAADASKRRRTQIVWVRPGRDPWAILHGQAEADFAWRCERPIEQRWLQRPNQRLYVDPITGPHTWWDPGGEWPVMVPCRKCWPCQLSRRREWIARAVNEARAAKRTWFFSGTFREMPESPDAVVDEYQRYMKRLRKQIGSSVKLRYLTVLERGERNGRLHVHSLMHFSDVVKWVQVTRPWTAGFFKANWVRCQFGEDGRMDDESARQIFYVAGYVTGDISMKVRGGGR